MSNTNKASGGYMTAWSEAEHFKPKLGEAVLVHLKAWEPDEWGAGFLGENDIFYLYSEPVEYSEIDYWMQIPPIPEGGL